MNYQKYIQTLIEEDIEKRENRLKDINDGDWKKFQKNMILHCKKALEEYQKD